MDIFISLVAVIGRFAAAVLAWPTDGPAAAH